jgi:hypothetical protein
MKSVMNPRVFALLTAILLATSCRSVAPQRVIDPALTSCVPPSTLIVAGIDLRQLRAAPLYSKLPDAALAFAGPVSSASYLILAFNGKQILAIARGDFPQAPAGATLIDRNLAISGAADYMNAAAAQYKTGATGAPGLIEQAESIAAGRQIWIVAKGGVRLPLTGNASNLNRLLRDSEDASIAARVDSGLTLDLTAHGRTPDAAREFEETLRGFLSLTAAFESHQPDLVAMLNSVKITRQDRTVHGALTTGPEASVKLLGELLH